MNPAFENKLKPLFPSVQFNAKVKLGSADRKILEVTVFPNIERLATQPKTKETLIRFSGPFIANLLKAYREKSPPLGVEVLVRGKIQAKGMPEISSLAVDKVIKHLSKEGYIIKTPVEREFEVVNSAAFWATEKLIAHVSGQITSKTCRTCAVEKPIGDFGRQRNGYETECKTCRTARKKAARKKIARQ